MTKRRKLYFAHPINTYGEPIERECLDILRKNFPDHEIVNPSDKKHKDKVDELRKNDPKVNVMPYFEGLVAECDDNAVLPFGDGMWGAGVFGEAIVTFREGGDIYEISVSDHSVQYLVALPGLKRLSVEETISRIRNPDGTRKPYV